MSSSIFGSKSSAAQTSEDHWIPLSDLMTGLMMMFMLVAITFMVKIEAEANNVRALKDQAVAEATKSRALRDQAEVQAARMRNVALIYDELRIKLYQDLYAEFKSDLPKWQAEIDPDLAIRFKEPDVLFETGKSTLKPRFIEILDDFFPRYIRILSGDKYKSSIEEIRIEGHTSSVWNATVTGDKAYLLNMELSQSRTRSVLQYVLGFPRPADEQRWLISALTANGLSSSKLRLNADGTENRDASQRVEFRVRTNADSRIAEVLKAGER